MSKHSEEVLRLVQTHINYYLDHDWIVEPSNLFSDSTNCLDTVWNQLLKTLQIPLWSFASFIADFICTIGPATGDVERYLGMYVVHKTVQQRRW